MKKNFLGIAAIVIALSASAFTTSTKVSHKRDTNLKWFTISGSFTTSQSIPSANATYRAGEDGPDAPTGVCSGSGHQCVSGFDPSQVNASNQLIGTQMPVDPTSDQKN